METETETAIEPENRVRNLNFCEKFQNFAVQVVWVACSESALTIYLIFHWLVACGTHITYSHDDSAAFLSFLYFMATLLAFLSVMAHVSGLLIPIFIYCAINSFVLLMLTQLFCLSGPGAERVRERVCSAELTRFYCESMAESRSGTLFKTVFFVLLCIHTCYAIVFQFRRNEQYARELEMHHRNGPPYFMNFGGPPNEHHGATNLDEPPRYSTLEPITTPKAESTVTSPPRYSYWERTFGKENEKS